MCVNIPQSRVKVRWQLDLFHESAGVFFLTFQHRVTLAVQKCFDPPNGTITPLIGKQQQRVNQRAVNYYNHENKE